MTENNTNKKNRKNSNRNSNNKIRNSNTNYSSKKDDVVKVPPMSGRPFEYKMSKLMAENILNDANSRRHPQEILCEYVNTQCGIMGYCIRVIIDSD